MAHFSFTNSLYDDCNLEKKKQESLAPFNWVTDPLYQNSQDVYVNASPFIQNQYKTVPSKGIDIDTDLKNMNRPLSRCPEAKFNPVVNCKACEKCDQGLPCGCLHCQETKFQNKLNEAQNPSLVPEYTRINKPCNIFSGISINRFHPLCEDLQDSNKIQSNSYIGTNTRLQVKDAFKNENVHQTSSQQLDIKPYKL